MRAGTRILVVEDDESIAQLVELELEHRNFNVRCAYDGLAGLEELQRFEPEVVILDIMLPKLDGVGVLRRLRQQGVSTPVIMLTARDSSLDKVHSLDHGADDYLTKPFDIEELMARLRALVRRAQGEEVLRVGDLEVNTATRQVHRCGTEMSLRPASTSYWSSWPAISARCSPGISCVRGYGSRSSASGPTSWTCTWATSERR